MNWRLEEEANDKLEIKGGRALSVASSISMFQPFHLTSYEISNNGI